MWINNGGGILTFYVKYAIINMFKNLAERKERKYGRKIDSDIKGSGD